MATFRDGNDNEWTLRIDTWQIRVVREATGFEIGKLLADDMARWKELASDPVLFGRVLMSLCAAQVKELGTSEEQFHRALAGDCLGDAHEAFERAYMDFCPSRQRALLAAMKEKSAEIEAVTMERAMEGIRNLDANATTTASNGSAGSSPESSASTPAPVG